VLWNERQGFHPRARGSDCRKPCSILRSERFTHVREGATWAALVSVFRGFTHAREGATSWKALQAANNPRFTHAREGATSERIALPGAARSFHPRARGSDKAPVRVSWVLPAVCPHAREEATCVDEDWTVKRTKVCPRARGSDVVSPTREEATEYDFEC
jgi:hypothetical protein